MIIPIRNFLMTHMRKLTRSSVFFLVIAGSVYGLSEIGVIQGGREAPLRKVGDVSASIGFVTLVTAYAGVLLDAVVKDIQGTAKNAPKPVSIEGSSDGSL